MKNIEAFCMASNIIKNEYEYIHTFNLMNQFAKKITVVVGPSEDNTLEELKKLKGVYNLNIIEKNWKGKGDVFLREGKDLARQACHNGWVYLTDLDEHLPEETISIIKSLEPENKENIWFPFINMSDAGVVLDGVYHDIVPRLFYNDEHAKVFGDGFGGARSQSHQLLLFNAPILHFGFSSEKKWTIKHNLYGVEDSGIPKGMRREYIPRKINEPDNSIVKIKHDDKDLLNKSLLFMVMQIMGRAVSNAYKGNYIDYEGDRKRMYGK